MRRTTRPNNGGAAGHPSPATNVRASGRVYANSSDPLELNAAAGVDIATRLDLPRYNTGSLSNEEARTVYAEGKLRIIRQDQQLAKQGASLEQRARQSSEKRNALRTWIREIMADRTVALALEETDPNMTWDEVVTKYQLYGASGDDLYTMIIEKSAGSRVSVDTHFGIDPGNPGKLPAIRPCAPFRRPGASPPPPPEAAR